MVSKNPLKNMSNISDEAIQSTNSDASKFKSYAVSKGYYSDPFINLFSKSLSSESNSEHRAPEMSRGYFARVHATKNLVTQFLNETNCRCQIINIGAGYDTMFFNFKSQNKVPLKYIEIDFQRICKLKCQIIRTKKKSLVKKTSIE